MWDRYLWGVEFQANDGRIVLLGEGWNGIKEPDYKGQPSRVLLFTSRELARKWCHAKQQNYSGRQDLCKHWRFRPVKVRERVEKVDR